MIIKNIINYLHRSNKNIKLDFINLKLTADNFKNEFFIDEIIDAFLIHTNSNIEALNLERFFILIEKLNVSALCEKTINKLLNHTKIGMYINDLIDKKLIRDNHVFQLVDNDLNKEFVEGLELIIGNAKKEMQKSIFDRISYFVLKKTINEENLNFIINLLTTISQYNVDRVLKIAAFHKIQPVIQQIIYCYGKEICPSYIFKLGCEFNIPFLTRYALSNLKSLDISKINIDTTFTYAIRNDDKAAVTYMLSHVPTFGAYLSVEALCAKDSKFYYAVFNTVINKLSGEHLEITFQIVCLKGQTNKFFIALANNEINNKLTYNEDFLKTSLSIIQNTHIFKVLIKYNLSSMLFQEVLHSYLTRQSVPLEFFKIAFAHYKFSNKEIDSFIQKCRSKNRFDVLQVIGKYYLKPQLNKCLLMLKRDQYLAWSVNPTQHLLEGISVTVLSQDGLTKQEIPILIELLQQRLNQHHLMKRCVDKVLEANMKICDTTRNSLADIVTMKLCL